MVTITSQLSSRADHICHFGFHFFSSTSCTKFVTGMNISVFRRGIFASRTLVRYPVFQARLASNAAAKWDKTSLDKIVQKDKVVVFMKGVPSQPMCGFSNAVVQVLRMHGVDEYGSYNILDDEDLRSEMKTYSNWPTFPQVYVGGEFLGGCDIMIQLHQNGELIEELEKVGIRSCLLDKAKEK